MTPAPPRLVVDASALVGLLLDPGAHVALAERLGARLLTADRRLAAAPGPRCPIVLA